MTATLTRSEVEAVVAKLSEAQRFWLRRLPANQRAVDRRSANALIRLGLAEDAGNVPNPHMPAWPCPATRCTPLGKRVRDYLKDHPNATG